MPTFTPASVPPGARAPTLGEAASRVLSEQLERLRAATSSQGWMSGAPEVKAARTSARRLRAALRFFGPYIDAKNAARLIRELEFLTAALGEVRDCDVVLGELVSFDPGIDLLAGCGRHLRRARELAEARLQRYAKRGRLRLLCSRIGRYGASISHTRRSMSALSVSMLQQRYEALRRDATELDLHDIESIHRARRALRRFRYGLECVAPSITVDAGFLTAVKAAQDHLGRLNDLGLVVRIVTPLLEVQSLQPEWPLLQAFVNDCRRNLEAFILGVPALLRTCTSGGLPASPAGASAVR